MPGLAVGVVLLLQVRHAAVLEEIRREKDGIWRTLGLALACHALGRRAEADAVLRAFTENHAREAAYQVAQAHPCRGEVDQAFTWLERVHAQRDGGFVEFKDDPLPVSLEGDPRHRELLRRLRLPE